MPNNRLFSVVVLTLALLAQGALAFAPAVHHGLCGLGDETGAAMSAADCGHPMGDRDAGCAQCSHCSGGHCLAWAVPAGSPTLAAVPVAVERSLSQLAQPPADPPARIYRPPRLLA